MQAMLQACMIALIAHVAYASATANLHARLNSYHSDPVDRCAGGSARRHGLQTMVTFEVAAALLMAGRQ